MPLTEKGTILSSNYAYPSVVSTLGDMTKTARRVLVGLYAEGKTGRDFLRTKAQIAIACVNENRFRNQFNVASEDGVLKAMTEVKNMPYFTAQGYALGIAYASSLSGDTVASVLIGGMATVMNGHFEVRSGQMLQWYFDFEAGAFHSNTGAHPAGTRKASANLLFNGKHASLDAMMKPPMLSTTDNLRNEFHKRQLGTEDSYGDAGDGPGSKKRFIAYPKPFLLDENGEEHYGDKIRVFAKCVNGGRPHEPIDIMLCTQSL